MTTRLLVLSISLALAACEPAAQVPDTPLGTWQVLAEDLPGSLLSVQGRSADDLWVTGSDPEDGIGGYVLRWDGDAWARLDPPLDGDVWWSSSPTADLTFFVGSGGLALRWTEASGALEAIPTGVTDTLYGVTAFGPGDAWAVGGDSTGAGRSHVILRWDGAAWTEEANLPGAIDDRATFFKIWGTSSDDLWVSGTQGTMLHRAAGIWTLCTLQAPTDLLTVHGQGDAVFAVGGVAAGRVVARSETSLYFEDVTAGLMPRLYGIHVGADGQPTVVGDDGFVATRTADGWEEDTTAPFRDFGYHSVWRDPDGGLWAAGGQFLWLPFFQGQLLYRGDALSDAARALQDLL